MNTESPARRAMSRVAVAIVAAFAVVALKRFARRRPVETVSPGVQSVPQATVTA